MTKDLCIIPSSKPFRSSASTVYKPKLLSWSESTNRLNHISAFGLQPVCTYWVRQIRPLPLDR